MIGRTTSSRALVLTAPRELEFRDLPVPHPEVDGALLRVEACGLCGTDHEMFTGRLPAATPLVPGHETVGIIEEIGDVAAEQWGVSVGDRVAVECFQSCRRCGPCLSGAYRRCESNGLRTAYGLSPVDVGSGLSGGWADHHWLGPDSMLVSVPDGLDAIDATLFNPVGAGIRWGAELPETGPGDVVAVLGPGIRGLAAAAAAREAGAAFVMITGRGAHDHPRLEAAARFGADLAVDIDQEDPVKALRAATGGHGATVVVDVTANAPDALGQAVKMAATGGRIVLAGTRNSAETPGFHPDAIVYKELHLIGALGVDAPAYRRALDLIATHHYPFCSVTRRVETLEQAGELLAAMAGEGDEPPPIHAVLTP
ncbi:MAG TPA: alcohol dehydrogenase [Acidimicrobiaceae bacterium]|jgi:alcohol dehydrogenase|nr:MAG: alcohol dehydrogenase [Actinomycetota bacterium]HBL09147.1 alcohol dehydrogenase [Acidimicrobiaceae bacterium]HIM85841.1 alcohol dehydrogenase [Acidimicrobiia bacterium]